MQVKEKSKVSRWHPSAYKLCFLPCNILRIPFGPEGFLFPQIYYLEWPDRSDKQNPYARYYPFTKELTCYERLLVPTLEFQHFVSKEAAEMHRTEALKMCNIKPRSAPSFPEKIFFYQRAKDRVISNAEALCSDLRDHGWKTYLETEDREDFCTLVQSMYDADIIITTDGSHNSLLPYARAGSVVVIVFPYNNRLPDWKLMAYYSGLRVLEIMTINSSYSSHPSETTWPNYHKNGVEYWTLNATLRECTYILCRMALRSRNTFVPIETLLKFLKRAKEIFNDGNNQDCEKPLPWPRPVNYDSPIIDHWIQYGWENNYAVCEPPAPDCICCQSESCLDGTNRIVRPF